MVLNSITFFEQGSYLGLESIEICLLKWKFFGKKEK